MAGFEVTPEVTGSVFLLNSPYTMLRQSNPPMAAELLREAQHDVDLRWKTYEHLAQQPVANIAAALQSVVPSKRSRQRGRRTMVDLSTSYAELTRGRFAAMLRRIAMLPLPASERLAVENANRIPENP
jgi:hypothetical protein